MKNAIIYILIITMCLVSTAQAANPANWNFSLTSYGSNASWTSSNSVDTGFPQYDYNWNLTGASLQVGGQMWVSILDLISPINKSGSGSFNGLPSGELFHLVMGDILTGDLVGSIDASGIGHGSLENITFGQIQGYTVTGAQFSGNISVEAIPEPATLAILGLGALMIRKRNK